MKCLALVLTTVIALSPCPLVARDDAPRANETPAATGPIALFRTFARGQLTAQGFTRHEAIVAGQPLVWWEKGTGPALVLIHGVGDHAGTWYTVTTPLAEGRRLLLVDLPGHGESGPADGPLPMSTVIAGLDAWITSQVFSATTHTELVGNSMGAWLALLVAQRHPDRIRRIVMTNGGPLRADTGELDLLPRDRKEARQLMAALRDPANPPIPDPVLDDLVRRAPGGQVERMFEATEDLESYLTTEGQLAEVGTPVEVLWGVSDRYLGEAYPQRLVKGLPCVRFTAVETCGHVPQAECPERYAARLTAVLAKAPPGPTDRGESHD